MFEPAEGVLGDAKMIASAMIKRGESSAPYPDDEDPMFHVVTDESLLDSTMVRFEIDGTKVFMGFLRATDAE